MAKRVLPPKGGSHAHGSHEPQPGEPVSELLPDRPTLAAVREIAAGCKACDLYKRGTQTVFGEGPHKAQVMLVGEQPGDAEDLAGHPFVGPAGKLLDTALEEAGIDRRKVYVTNVVKHFKWEPRGKRRIHAKPNAAEIGACRPWLETEIALVKPHVLVCLGATAAQALLGRAFKVSKQRGQRVESPLAPIVTATVHPSSILRAPDDEARRAEMRRFVQDLKKIAREITRARSGEQGAPARAPVGGAGGAKPPRKDG
jgi:uracil-DNA glycosylase family protein